MIIRQKIRGKKKYFYLEHSIRKKNKIIKKERYLGTEIPKEIDEIKAEFLKELKVDLYKKFEKIRENFQDEWKRVPESAREKELEEISIAFTYNTNAIEGSTITLEEVREIIQENIAPNKPIRDIREAENHNKVFLDMLKHKEDLTIKLLLNWHQRIFGDSKPDISGKFRDYLVRIGSYIAPGWQDVEDLMNEFIKFIEKNKKMNPVELAGKGHYKFESIHPFGDGNGRIGRLLMNFILWNSGYPMIIIEYKNRASYYKAFPKGQEAFVDYFLRRYLSVHKKRYLKK
ncbi:MAG: Fic family protein [Candidatus Diapherotrites archaeon]